MPTVNPRINVTLSQSLDLLVSQLATHQRVSKATVLRELLEVAEPSLRHVVAMLDAAQGASVEARKRLVEDLDKSIKKADGTAQRLMASLAHNTRDLVADAEAVQGRRPAVARRGAPATGIRRAAVGRRPGPKDPPISNRGVK